MAKATSRKHATHKKTRGHHAAKTRAGRSNSSGPSTSGGSSARETKPEIAGDESVLQVESRAVDENADDEPGIYGLNRGETAG